MKDRTDQEQSDPAWVVGAVEARRRGDDAIPSGGKHGDVQAEPLMERVLDPENLDRAWRKVRSNAGAAGIDGMSVGMFPALALEHWSRIRSMLMEGTYHPAAVRRVFIPKPDGTERPLGIPTVRDRVVQTARDASDSGADL